MGARLVTLLVCLPALAVLAGLYGALHDQLSFTISPEYFTRFKYEQFGFDPAWFGGHRPTVAVIGFLATWWVGLFIGAFLGMTAMLQNDAARMRKALKRGTLFTWATAVFAGLGGLIIGWFLLDTVPQGWHLPSGLADPHAFLAVGAMHNAGYGGGVLGLIIALTDMEWRRQREAQAP
jgi:hypothetical protein